MSFGIGFSGLNAAKDDLDVISNNIANSNTVGYKSSRSEFADLYAYSLGNDSVGTGVKVSSVSQSFTQGSLDSTGRELDMAIVGSGFFVVSDDDGEQFFTRAGYFDLDADSKIVNNEGYHLQGYAADANGNILGGNLVDLGINFSEITGKATTSIEGAANLDARNAVIPSATAFDPLNQDSYNSSMAFNVYDSQGNAHTLGLYLAKAAGNEWTGYFQVDGETIMNGANPAEITFNFSNGGALTSISGSTLPGATVAADNVTINGFSIESDDYLGGDGTAGSGPVDDISLTLDFTSFTQMGTDFYVTRSSQDGFPPGKLTNIQISDDGFLRTLYSNGRSFVQGQVVLAAFANENGLASSGDSLWINSQESGSPLYGVPGSGTMGEMKTASLEASNVDLSQELVKLIEAQRNYQANAKSIETASSLSQTLMNII